MPTRSSQSCRILRCLALAVWTVTITDEDRQKMQERYCIDHAADQTRLARPGRRIVLEAVAR